MSSMSYEGKEEEDGGEELSPAYHASYCLGVDWVGGEEEGSRESSGRAGQEGDEEGVKEVADEGVEEQVGQVELGGRARSKDPVQSEGERCERPVGLVGAGVGEGNAPEV